MGAVMMVADLGGGGGCEALKESSWAALCIICIFISAILDSFSFRSVGLRLGSLRTFSSMASVDAVILSKELWPELAGTGAEEAVVVPVPVAALVAGGVCVGTGAGAGASEEVERLVEDDAGRLDAAESSEPKTSAPLRIL